MRNTWRVAGAIAIAWVTFLGLLLSAESGLQPSPPLPPAAPQGQVTTTDAKPVAGTGRLTGVVIAGDTGAPVKRASVSISGGTILDPATGRPPVRGTSIQIQSSIGGGRGVPYGMVSKSVETDTGGRFAFDGLPAGRYNISVNVRSGYVRTSSETAELADGGTANITFRLDRTGAITGKVLDDNGEPIQGIQLRASRWDSMAGVRRLMPYYGNGANSVTNDLGEYRLYDVPPGDYFIAATYPSYGPSPLQENGASPEPRFGFAPTFYPSTASPAMARTISVRAGHDTPGIDITLQRAPMGRAIATVVDSTGSPVTQRAGVGISSRSDAAASGGGMIAQRDGTFRSTDLPPGDYFVYANFMRGDGQTGVLEAAVAPVTINGDEAQVHLTTNAGATLSGRVVMEGKPPDLSGMPAGRGGASGLRVSIAARPAYVGSGYQAATSSGRGATMAEDGTFELKGLRGTVRIMASGPRMALKAVRQGSQDILAKPLELTGTENLSDIEIVLTSDTGGVEGGVTNSKGEPAAGAYVVIFPDDASQWFESSPFVRQTSAATAPAGTAGPGAPQFSTSTTLTPSAGGIPGTAPASSLGGSQRLTAGSGNRLAPGSFSTQTLLPGRYGVVAFERSGTNMPAYDPDALEALRSRATYVTVKAGETAHVDIRTIKQ